MAAKFSHSLTHIHNVINSNANRMLIEREGELFGTLCGLRRSKYYFPLLKLQAPQMIWYLPKTDASENPPPPPPPLTTPPAASSSKAAWRRVTSVALTPFWSRPRFANSALSSTTFNLAGSMFWLAPNEKKLKAKCVSLSQNANRLSPLLLLFFRWQVSLFPSFSLHLLFLATERNTLLTHTNTSLAQCFCFTLSLSHHRPHWLLFSLLQFARSKYTKADGGKRGVERWRTFFFTQYTRNLVFNQ